VQFAAVANPDPPNANLLKAVANASKEGTRLLWTRVFLFFQHLLHQQFLYIVRDFIGYYFKTNSNQ
jgi:hypothetical protein